MAEQRAFGFVLGVGAASAVAGAAMFWLARQPDSAHSSRATYTDVESYCAARVQSVPDAERALHETTCRLTLRGALDSLAAHRFVDSIDQVRAVDALLRDQPAAASPPIASATLAPAVRDERSFDLQRPARAEASLPKRVRTKESGDLLDPFAAPKERATTSQDFIDPFASRRADTRDATPAEPVRASNRSHTKAGDLTDPFPNPY